MERCHAAVTPLLKSKFAMLQIERTLALLDEPNTSQYRRCTEATLRSSTDETTIMSVSTHIYLIARPVLSGSALHFIYCAA